MGKVKASDLSPGAIVLFGSGETGPVGREALRWLRSSGRIPRRITVLETPAGFEPNADAVARRWANALRRQAEAREAELTQLPLRRRGTPLGPDVAQLAAPLLGSDLIVLGPGSPTYAARQLRGSVAWRNAEAAHLLGASFFLASAAAMAAGTWALPVYEIYKVGEDPHWAEGLDLFRHLGLSLAVVTHWDNADGGAAVDTSRAFIGQARFEELLALVPNDTVVVGVDENTGLALDPADGSATVLGRGGVTIVRERIAERHGRGERLTLDAFGPFAPPDADAVPVELADAVRAARAEREPQPAPEDIAALVAAREVARKRRDWATADDIRRTLGQRGWRVEDTPDGPRVLAMRAETGHDAGRP